MREPVDDLDAVRQISAVLGAFEARGGLEAVEDFDKNTYRAVYKVQLGDVVYVRASRLSEVGVGQGDTEGRHRSHQVAAQVGEAGPRTANQGKGEVVKTKTGKKHSTITEGSGNVFADMGVPEPEHALAKAKLAAKIAAAIEEEELTQTEAAERLGTDQAKVSAIVRGRLDQFSTERLLQYAQMIGYDVEIRFSRRHQGTGRLRIGA